MSEHYSHLLIPENPEFIPQLLQVAAFLRGLTALGSAPIGATLRVGKLLGRVLTGRNVYTGETLTIPVRDFAPVAGMNELSEELKTLDDFDIGLSGQGTSELAPFKLYLPQDHAWQSEVKEAYHYEVLCKLRRSRTSLNAESYLSSCAPKIGEAVFRNPWNNGIIKVPNAACAQFWIEFQFGNWLVPKIEGSLNLLPPDIVAAAVDCFGQSFAQGCHFG